MALRPYQTDAVFAMLEDLDKPGNSVLCLGTAAGKSHIIADYVRAIRQPALILCPNREILEQNKEKLSNLVDKKDIGVFSASMNEKTIKLYTLATIGSIFRKPELFQQFGTVIVDECQAVRPDKYGSMYLKLFRKTSPQKVFGLTASPYINVSQVKFVGMENGMKVCEASTILQLITRMASGFWNRIIFNYDSKMLRENGYTVPVIYNDYHLIGPDNLRLNSAGTEYDQDAFVRQTVGQHNKVVQICERARDKYVSTLVFCANVAQAEMLSRLVEGSAVVTAKTHPKERGETIDKFKSGEIKILFNVSCLTTGFDSPRTDCLIVLRPTKSLGLYQQFIGRGVRVSPETGKKWCKVIDLSGTHFRLGDAEAIRLIQENGVWDITSQSGKRWHNSVIGSYRIKTAY